ncbi:hypothetical protein [Neisseria yangbaofengii]|nr:hypothetical protein [Neisseria yangbaofengii]
MFFDFDVEAVITSVKAALFAYALVVGIDFALAAIGVVVTFAVIAVS